MLRCHTLECQKIKRLNKVRFLTGIFSRRRRVVLRGIINGSVFPYGSHFKKKMPG
jgi:hypothetical protein